MPKEFRKRGKRKPKVSKEDTSEAEIKPLEPVESTDSKTEAGPSWIGSSSQGGHSDSDAPFGYVDPDVKAYFRVVDNQLREWQENVDEEAEEDADADPNESV